MTGPIGADSWMDVAAYAVVGIPALVASLGALRVVKKASAKQEAIGQDVSVVREHVANTHESNLRADVDTLLVGMVEVRRAVGRSGDEVHDERAANAGDRREMWAHIRRQDRIADKHHPDEP